MASDKVHDGREQGGGSRDESTGRLALRVVLRIAAIVLGAAILVVGLYALWIWKMLSNGTLVD